MKDVLGSAIMDYFNGERKYKLWVKDTFGPKVEMKTAYYFRSKYELPELELKALALCEGKILDIGAAAGAHSLILQQEGKDVTALDISSLNCEVISQRGVKQVIHADFFNTDINQYNTLLLLMNGIGICGTISGIKHFLSHIQDFIHNGGKVILDSSDIDYMYLDDDLQFPIDNYYGEVQCAYEYKNTISEWLTWIYIDYTTLSGLVNDAGYSINKIMEDDSQQYLAIISKG